VDPVEAAPARLMLYTHQLGWELRVESGDLLMTQVCRSDREIEEVSAGWEEAMIESPTFVVLGPELSGVGLRYRTLAEAQTHAAAVAEPTRADVWYYASDTDHGVLLATYRDR
jgi:alpha-glucuronidase